LQQHDGLPGVLGRVEAGALQQQATVGRHELEVELAVLFAVLLEGGQCGLGGLRGLGVAAAWARLRRPTAAQFAQEGVAISRARWAPASSVASMRAGSGSAPRSVRAGGPRCRPHARTTAVWHRPRPCLRRRPGAGPRSARGGKAW
jgi:Zn-dependent protease